MHSDEAVNELERIQEEERSLVAGGEEGEDRQAEAQETQETLQKLESRQLRARRELIQLHADKLEELRRAQCLRFVAKLEQEEEMLHKLTQDTAREDTPTKATNATVGEEATEAESLQESEKVLEDGLAACSSAPAFVVEKGKSSGKVALSVASASALSSAFKLGKSVAAPWVGYLPESLSLLSEQRSIEELEGQSDSCTYTASYGIEKYLGTQHKVLFNVQVTTVLKDIWFGLEECSKTPVQDLSDGTTCLLLRQPVTGGPISGRFRKLLDITPELYFKNTDTTTGQNDEKPSDVKITKHSSLGLGVCAVLHVKDDSETFGALEKALCLTSRYKFRHAIVPLRQWIEEEVEEENQTAKSLDPKLVERIFKAAKAALQNIAHSSQMSYSLTKISFVLNSSIPHSDAHEHYLEASKGMVRSQSEPFIARDKARVAKAGQLLSRAFGVHQQK